MSLPNNNPPLLLLGASGFLGWNLLQNVEYHRTVIAQSNDHHLDLKGTRGTISSLKLNLLAPDALKQLLQIDHSGIIYAAAYSNISSCDQHPLHSHQINVEIPLKLASHCSKTNRAFVYYSSDLVFDGKQAPYDERSLTTPLSLYGQQKSDAEYKILDANPKACVYRLPLLFGEAGCFAGSSLQSMLSTLNNKQSLNLFTDEFRSPARAKAIAEFTWKQLGEISGLFNLGGPERISRYDMGKILCETFKFPLKWLNPILQSDLPNLKPRPSDCSLISQHAVQLGYNARPYREEMQSIFNLYQSSLP